MAANARYVIWLHESERCEVFLSHGLKLWSWHMRCHDMKNKANLLLTFLVWGCLLPVPP